MEWLLTVLIVTTFNTTAPPTVSIERLSGIDSREHCLAVGLHTSAVVLEPDFRLPGERFLLLDQPATRRVIISCDLVWSI